MAVSQNDAHPFAGSLSTVIDSTNRDKRPNDFYTADYSKSLNNITTGGREGLNRQNVQTALRGKQERLKQLVRCGVAAEVRKTYWMSTLSSESASHPGDMYKAAMGGTPEERSKDNDIDMVTSCGWLHDPSVLTLPTLPGIAVGVKRRLLSTLKRNHSHVTFCPLLPVLASLLINFLEEAECFTLLDEILHKPGWLSRDQRENLASLNTMATIFKYKCKHSYHDLMRFKPAAIQEEHFVCMMMANWREWIFFNQPLWFMIRVLDVFVVEGPKILYRLATSCLSLYVERVLCTSNGAPLPDMSIDIEKYVHGFSWAERGLWFKRAFKVNVARRTVKSVWFAELAKLPPFEDTQEESFQAFDQSDSSSLQNEIKVQVTKEMVNGMLNEKQWQLLWTWLPDLYQLKVPICTYKASKDGYSLKSIYRKLKGEHGFLLFIKTTNAEVLGTFVASDLDEGKQRDKFFGTGETFLFSLWPLAACYQWTGESNLILLANDKEFAVGAGGGAFGLWIDGDINHGSSAKCLAYGNLPLVKEGQFKIIDVEVFIFTDAM